MADLRLSLNFNIESIYPTNLVGQARNTLDKAPAVRVPRGAGRRPGDRERMTALPQWLNASGLVWDSLGLYGLAGTSRRRTNEEFSVDPRQAPRPHRQTPL